MKWVFYNSLSMKRFIILSIEQQVELKRLMKSEKNIKIHRRLQFIEMKSQGKKNTEIMPLLKVSMETCRDWLGIFLAHGFTWLCSLKYSWRRPWKLTEKKDEIKKYVDENLISHLTTLKHWIEQELSISVQTSWLGEWCKKNSIILTRNWKSSLENINLKQYNKHI